MAAALTSLLLGRWWLTGHGPRRSKVSLHRTALCQEMMVSNCIAKVNCLLGGKSGPRTQNRGWTSLGRNKNYTRERIQVIWNWSETQLCYKQPHLLVFAFHSMSFIFWEYQANVSFGSTQFWFYENEWIESMKQKSKELHNCFTQVTTGMFYIIYYHEKLIESSLHLESIATCHGEWNGNLKPRFSEELTV